MGVAVPPFDRYDALPHAGPVVLSVPHAGREYPADAIAAVRGPARALRALEDRYVDRIALAARRGEAMLVQRRARAWIDLNRGEDERDPKIDEGADAAAAPSAKVRSGLGLVPRRAGGVAAIWRRRFGDAEIVARIESDHRPYHAALAAMLAETRDRFGVAVLVDLHSMPPLGPGGAGIVVGDRYGRSSADRFVARAMATMTAAGFAVARNAPYAGGHILQRHGDPARRIHAIQVEIDRASYLDARFDAPGPGLSRVAAAVAAMLAALADEAMPTAQSEPIAAE